MAVLLAAALVVGGLALAQRSAARRAEQQANTNAVRADANAATAKANATRADENAATAEINAGMARSNAADATAARVGAELREVSLQARTLADTQPDLALLLAAEVAQRQPGAAANEAVLATVVANPSISRIVDLGLTADDIGVVAAAASITGPLVVSTHVRTVVVGRDTLTPTGVDWPHAPDDALVALNASGTVAVTVTDAGDVQRHDVTTGDLVGPVITVAPLSVQRIPVAYLGDHLVVADGSHVLTFPVDPAASPTSTDVAGEVTGIAASPDGTTLAVLTAGHTELFDTATGRRRPVAIAALSAAFSADGSTLYLTEPAGASDLSMVGVDVRAGATTGALTVAGVGLGGTMSVLDTGELLVSSSELGTSVLVDEALTTSRRITRSNVSQILLPWPDGHAIGSLGSRLAVIDTTATPAIATRLGFTGYVQVSADGTRLAANDAGGTSVRDTATMQPVGPTITALPAPPLAGFEQYRLAISPDGRYLAGAPGSDALGAPGQIVVRMYDAATGSQLGPDLPAGTLPSPAFSLDGRLLALHSPDGIGIYSVPDLALVRDVPIADPLGVGITWSPDSSELVMSDRIPHASRVDVATGTVTTLPFGHWRAGYSADGRFIASAGLGPVRITDRATGAVTEMPAFADWTQEIAFVPGTTWLERKTTSGWELIDTTTQTVVGDDSPFRSTRSSVRDTSPRTASR
ncbi:MAG: hypothetical protein QM733_19505 [Ilumatobacteraceae bacterium]